MMTTACLAPPLFVLIAAGAASSALEEVQPIALRRERARNERRPSGDGRGCVCQRRARLPASVCAAEQWRRGARELGRRGCGRAARARGSILYGRPARRGASPMEGTGAVRPRCCCC
eukprot:scaffold6820_cov282-Prasinococcus_capsulatus_cf.AAC.1